MKKNALCWLGCWVALLYFTGCGRVSSEAPGAHSVWLTSVPAAEAQAKSENKLVFLDFTGSDWCPPCIKLEEDVFSKPAFLDYAGKNLVLVMLDYPAQKKQPDDLAKANSALKDQYKIEGFPTQVLMKPDGTVVWKNLGYLEGGPSAMIAKMDEAKKK